MTLFRYELDFRQDNKVSYVQHYFKRMNISSFNHLTYFRDMPFLRIKIRQILIDIAKLQI